MQCRPLGLHVLIIIIIILANVNSRSRVTGQLADTPTRGLPTRGLDISRTGQLAARQLAD